MLDPFVMRSLWSFCRDYAGAVAPDLSRSGAWPICNEGIGRPDNNGQQKTTRVAKIQFEREPCVTTCQILGRSTISETARTIRLTARNSRRRRYGSGHYD